MQIDGAGNGLAQQAANTTANAQNQSGVPDRDDFSQILIGSGANEELVGGAGNDFLDGGGGIDTLIGGAGDDVINADSFSDEVRGGAGDDFIRASNNEILDPGEDDDTSGGDTARVAGELQGGAGDDIYDIGTGRHTIRDSQGNDTLRLEGNREDFTFVRDGENLTISNGTDTSILIADQFSSNEGNDQVGSGIETVEFADGSSLDLRELFGE